MHFNLRLLRLTPRNDGRQQRVIANHEARAMKQSCFAQNLTAKGIVQNVLNQHDAPNQKRRLFTSEYLPDDSQPLELPETSCGSINISRGIVGFFKILAE